jgi:hypothetical protein
MATNFAFPPIQGETVPNDNARLIMCHVAVISFTDWALCEGCGAALMFKGGCR